ncbi:MAG: DNRLRE domain-containing protein [Candidatus Eisenbacteria bacterium]|nr:DNRLRE domain-containing protein [Candidatus Eisenbacteria bacterium]
MPSDWFSRFAAGGMQRARSTPLRRPRPGRTGPVLPPARPATSVLLALLCLLPSCSEIEEPLDWRDSARGGLAETPITFAESSAVAAHHSYPAYVITGGSSYMLAGVLDRGALRLESSAYLRWDLDDLPEQGTIERAYVQMVLRSAEQADSSVTGPYRLWMYDLAGSWAEDSLETAPAPADFIASSGEINTGGLTDTSDVLLNTLFEDPDLIDLVSDWRSGDKENQGVVLRPDDTSERGFLQLISREGSPRGVVTDVLTPALVLEIDLGTKDTLITKEAVADAYVMDVAGEVLIDESELLVSSGYVRRGLLELTLADLLAAQPDSLPRGSVVHRATLALPIVTDSDWHLPSDETLTLYVYETFDAWSPGVDPESISANYISDAFISASDTTVVLDVRGPVQRIFEGQDLTLFLRCAGEVGTFRSLLLTVGGAGARTPVLDVSISRPSPGRLGEGS